MKATIRLPNGTVIETEGTPEEIRRTADQSPVIGVVPLYPYFTIEPVEKWWVDTWSTQQIQAACVHEYPAIWMGVQPPNCAKCYLPADTTRFTDVLGAGSVVQTSGNLMVKG